MRLYGGSVSFLQGCGPVQHYGRRCGLGIADQCADEEALPIGRNVEFPRNVEPRHHSRFEKRFRRRELKLRVAAFH